MPATLDDKMTTLSPEITAPAAAILRTLAYFDIFQYPLSNKEIRQFLVGRISEQEFEEALNELTDNRVIFLHSNFYGLHDDPQRAVRRIAGNKRALALIPKAIQIGRFLYRFPFVKAIAISGSLSKNFADEKADIDFFVITQKNRLWVARTIMHLFKKLTFLAGRQHYYCMNYFIDEEAMELEDKNIFTAMEVKTLLPVSGEKTINDFFEANQWTNECLPLCPFRKQQKQDGRQNIIKQFGEWCWNGRMGAQLDNYLMTLTTQRWKRKQERGKRNKKGYAMGLLTGKHYARSNPGSFQEKVLTMYREKVEELGMREAVSF